MHLRTRAKTKEITKTILELAGASLLTYACFASVKNVMRAGKVFDAFGDYSTARLRQALKRLKLQDMIQYDSKDLKSPIILTEKGMLRLVRRRFRDLFRRVKKWDYFWRIVFFDIPEKKKYLRDFLRRELLAAGFYPFQKSVFVCPFDCETDIQNLCEMYKISKHVLFCVTPSLGVKEKEVRKFFFSRARFGSERN